MKAFHVKVSRHYNHPATSLYAVVADYREGLPQILPKAYFKGWDVESGGQGAGTIVNVSMSFFGKKFLFRLAVTEPKPGSVLVETDTDTGKYTRFTFIPINDHESTLTIDSEIPVGPGVSGYFKARNVVFFAKRIYKQEMKNLADRLDRQQSKK
jgi:hypothetical protein